MPCMRGLGFCHVFRCARGNDLPAAGTTLGPQINEPVSCFDDIQIVLNDHHRIAAVSEPVEHFEKLPDIFKVETSRGLVKNIECVTGVALGEFT